MERYEMLITIPFFNKGSIYAFDNESGGVWRVGDDNVLFSHALRYELSEYLWLIRDDHMRKV